MRIILYGGAEEPGSGVSCYAASLRDLGHHVTAIAADAGLEWYSRGVGRRVRRLLGRRPIETDRRRHVAALIETVRRERPAIVIVIKGLLISGADVEALRALGPWVVILNHDDFFSQNPNNTSDLQRAAIPHYDYVFVTREVNVAEIAPLNPKVEFLPFAYYPRIHRRVLIPENERNLWETDVVFVGTWERERCALLEHLVVQVPARFAIWGAQWERIGRHSPLVPFVRHRNVFLDDMCKALGGAHVSLAFLRKMNRDDYTQRTFEIPACGGLLLGERTERHRRFFKEGVEAEFFSSNDPDELVHKVRLLLSDPQLRTSMREAGELALTRQHHTYQDRLERLLALHAARLGGSR